MHILVDMPKSDYENIKKEVEDNDITLSVYWYIASGKVLPEKHGPLKDVTQIGLTNFEIFMCNGDYKEVLKMLIERIENAPTIIEASEVKIHDE